MGVMHSWWQYIRKHWIATIIIASVGVIVLIILGYLFKWDWTGFNSGTSKITIISTSKVNYTAIVPQPSKSLWDWLQLLGVLAIPVVVGFGAVWFTTRQGKVADAENKDNQREAAHQTYIDKMSELLLEKKLRGSAEEDEVRTIARVRTLTVLRRLDAERKVSVLQFLHESGLIEKGNSMIALKGADLRNFDLWRADLSETNLSEAILSSANLGGANLSGAILSGAILSGANLRAAYLGEANLRGAWLDGADLWAANLSHADLGHADLSHANLSHANLGHADLNDTYLRDADLSEANLASVIGITIEELEKEAKSLKGATMPDGSIHP